MSDLRAARAGARDYPYPPYLLHHVWHEMEAGAKRKRAVFSVRAAEMMVPTAFSLTAKDTLERPAKQRGAEPPPLNTHCFIQILTDPTLCCGSGVAGDEAAEDDADLQFLETVSDAVQKAVEERTERRQKQRKEEEEEEKREKEREERAGGGWKPKSK